MPVDRREMHGAEADLIDPAWVAHQQTYEIACGLKTPRRANIAQLAGPGSDRKSGANYLRMAD